MTSDVATTIRSTGTWTASTTYDYKAESSAGSNVYTGAYQGGVVTHQATHTTFPGDYTNAETRNSYVWWDSALNNVTDYDAQSHTGALYPYHATYSYDSNGRLSSVGIVDGRSRTVSFVTDANGLILQRDENDANTTTGDPRELHFYFNGMAVGDVGNNGTSDIDYAASIAEHTATPGTGPFRNGGSTYIIQADFDQSYDPINGLTYENTASRYTVQDGDTLEGIAYQIWGDSSFWYMIADANGLSGSETLVAGQDLIIPNKVHNAHNSADTYRVYDPNEAIGNNSPTAPKPQKHGGGGCGAFGQVLLTIVAVVVTMVVAPYLVGLLGPVLGGAVAGAAGSIVSQGVGVATGIQSKFDWGAVAMAAIGGGVNGALGLAIPGSSLGAEVARGVLGNALTQGIGVATGLQKRFDWAAVAAAGVMAGVSHMVSNGMEGHAEYSDTGDLLQRASFGNQFVSGMAGALAGAGAATLINGRDFGDNLISLLPSVIGQTIGNIVAEGITQTSPMDQSIAIAQNLNNSGNQYAYSIDGDGNFQFLSDANGNLVPIDEGEPDGYPTPNSASIGYGSENFSSGSLENDYLSPSVRAQIQTTQIPSVHPNGINSGVMRMLKAGEATILQKAFNGTLDISKIRIMWEYDLHSDIPDSAAITRRMAAIENGKSVVVEVLDFAEQSYRADFSAIHSKSDFQRAFTLVHEATHVWQIQHGVHLSEEESKLRFRYKTPEGFPNAYPYELTSSTTWAKLNVEQQSDLVAFHWAKAYGPQNVPSPYWDPYSVKQMEAVIPFFGHH